jgi:hypothetical protein
MKYNKKQITKLLLHTSLGFIVAIILGMNYTYGYMAGFSAGQQEAKKICDKRIYETDQQYGKAIHELTFKKCEDVYKQLTKETKSPFMQEMVQKELTKTTKYKK